jgi:hypothetical protein
MWEAESYLTTWSRYGTGPVGRLSRAASSRFARAAARLAERLAEPDDVAIEGRLVRGRPWWT